MTFYPNASTSERYRPPHGAALGVICALLAACGGNEYVEPPPPTVVVSQPEKRTVTDYLRSTGMEAMTGADIVKIAPEMYSSSVEYPNSPIASHLKDIAQVYLADLGTRIFYTQHGSFDTHAGEAGAMKRSRLIPCWTCSPGPTLGKGRANFSRRWSGISC